MIWPHATSRNLVTIVFLLLVFLGLSLGIGTSTAIAADETAEKAPPSPEPALKFFGSAELLPAKKALMEGRFAQGIELLQIAAEGKHREEAFFRLGGVLIQLERHQESLDTLQTLVREFPRGRLNHKARFLLAEALIGLKRHDEASAIYEQEITHLISKARKEEIGQYYLKYADALAIEDREGGPQYEKAIELYRRALELEIPGLTDEEIRFKIARSFHELQRYSDEEKVLVAFKARHPTSTSLDEVEYRIAQARLKAGRQAEARKSFRDFLRLHPKSVRVPNARYGIALTYNMPEPRSDTELALGIKALEEFLAGAPTHEMAPKARFEIGRAYRHRGRLDEAVGAFKAFLSAYSENNTAEQLPDVRFQLAACFKGQKKFPAALAAYKDFLQKHPAHELWDDAQLQIVLTEFEWGLTLLGEKSHDEARNRFLDFVRDYPLDQRTPQAYFVLGALEVDRKDFPAAIREWQKLVSKYPGVDLASQAQFRIGLIYESEMRNLEKAVEAYEKVTYGPYQGEARFRLAAMKAKTLTLLSERAFTTAETPTIKVSTRNIEQLNMRAYHIDLRDYFLKRGTIFSVEDLDIDLIEPESKWTAPVEGYQRYAEISRQVELPFEEPGAYVINVSDDERTATALVMITDLQMILKSGREDILVFVEDVNRHLPAAGAEVVVSDGTKVLFKGKTGEDGVFHQAHDTLEASPSVRVLVAQNGHFASNNLDLSGLAAAEGLKAKAYLFTEKPIYRPGQCVHLKGFVREVAKGRYTVDQESSYSASLLSPEGRIVSTREITLDAFGGFASDFNLDGSAPLGTYSLQLEARAGWTEHLAFTVGQYTPPKVKVDFKLAADVFYQGETVKGVIKVFYNYGEPARGKLVRYSYGTGVTLEASVNDEGEVPVEIDTRDFGGAGHYELVAEVPDENVAARKLLHISDTGFNLALSLSRDVILAGEQITVEIEASKPDGKPAGPTPELRVIYLEEQDGIRSEREVQRIDAIALEEANGRGVVALELAKGGSYRLRAAARDRFDNLITTQQDLFVSGEEDAVKLRIFSETAAGDVGGAFTARVHTRTDPGLALLTCEGERIFRYEIRRLAKGDNTINLPVTADLAPNFTFAAALMDGHRFHKAELDLKVRSSLTVVLEPAAEEVEPGGTVKVKLTATDRAGNPVEARFALAAVDAALLARFPDPSASIHEYFFGRERMGRLRTDSSCTFEYKARTRTIDSALQEERKRRELRREEARAGLELADMLHDFEIIDEGLADRNEDDASGFLVGRGRKAPNLAGPATAGPAGPRGATTGGMARKRRSRDADKREKSMELAQSANKSIDDELRSKLASLGYNGGGQSDAPEQAAYYLRFAAPESEVAARFYDDAAAQFIAGQNWTLGKQVWLEPTAAETPSPELRRRFLETAYWNPSVTTGPDGTAEVEIDLPHNTTTWKLMARGLTKQTVGGQGDAEVRARKTFFVELHTPLDLTEGDRTTFTAMLVNTSDSELSAELTLAAEGAVEKVTPHTATVTVPAGGVEEVDFSVVAGLPGSICAQLEAVARAGSAEARGANVAHRDRLTRSLVVKPLGVEVATGVGGTVGTSHTVTCALPGDKAYSQTYMEITVGTSLSDILLHMARTSYRFCCLPTFADMASQVLVKLDTLSYLQRTGHGHTAVNITLRRGVEALIATLLLAQGDDGGVPWIRQGKASPLATAQSLKALALASSMGFEVPEEALVKAAYWLDRHQRRVSGDEKAFFLDAYSFHKKPDFTFLNSLFRKRNSLSIHGLALLALTFERSGHDDNARTLVNMLIERAGTGENPWGGAAGAEKRKPVANEEEIGSGWFENPTMTVAHAVLAVALVEPRHPLVKRGIASLLAQRHAFRQTGPAHAAVVRALSEYLAGARLATNRYTLDIAVNGELIERLKVDGPHPVTTFSVPQDKLVTGDNTIAFRYAGRGDYTYSVRMTGFTKDMTPRPYRESLVWLERRYLMAPLVHEGRPVSSGFKTVDLPQGFKTWEHDLEELNEGETAHVHLRCDFTRRTSRESMHPLVITDSLPAGCRVVESGISGRYDHYEIGAGTITFYVSGTRSRISYPIYAAHPGDYHTPPAVVRSIHSPSISNHSIAYELPLNARGSAKKIPYRMTPDELYNLGVAYDDDNNRTGSTELLEEFLSGYNPKERYLVDAAKRLFTAAFAASDDVRLIKYFELLRERAPSLALTFHETARVGSAYRARGEHEQSLQILGMVAASSFGREAKVAEALEREGEAAGSLLFLADLIHTYPDLPEIQSAYLALSQAVQDKAGAAGGQPVIAGMTRGRIMTAAIGLLIDFLAAYPENPATDEAAYSLVSALLDLEQSEKVVRLTPIFRERWPESRFLQSMEYAEAYALFEEGRYEEATTLLGKVADLDPARLDPKGRDNRDLAVYILGQIDHAKGRIASAIERYRQVVKKFADAAETVEFFTRKSVSLEEISDFRGGQKVNVTLTYRNVPTVTVSVYKVDLMKLCLLRKSLNNVTNINLAGITPAHVEQVELGDGRDYKEKKKDLELPLAEKGAYMVVVQGEGAGCTGMILVTDLALEVQEDGGSGRVRVNVKDREKGAFLKNVYVKVIGSQQSVFQSGLTDLRGVFIADGVQGTSTVIAEREGEYAFHRGKLALLAQPVPQQQLRSKGMEQQEIQFKGRSRALQNIFSENRELQQRGVQALQEIYQEDNRNVQIK